MKKYHVKGRAASLFDAKCPWRGEADNNPDRAVVLPKATGFVIVTVSGRNLREGAKRCHL